MKMNNTYIHKSDSRKASKTKKLWAKRKYFTPSQNNELVVYVHILHHVAPISVHSTRERASERASKQARALNPAKNMLRLNVSYSIENIKYNNGSACPS